MWKRRRKRWQGLGDNYRRERHAGVFPAERVETGIEGRGPLSGILMPQDAESGSLAPFRMGQCIKACPNSSCSALAESYDWLFAGCNAHS